MKKFVLFSKPEGNSQMPRILAEIFPADLPSRHVGFMPANGVAECKPEFIAYWKTQAAKFKASFEVIDNAAYLESPDANTRELEKMAKINILILSGGDTQVFLDNLRLSGLDMAIMTLSQQPAWIIAGFSAGAMILTPTIKIRKLWQSVDRPEEEMTGLGLLNFEVCPHYDQSKIGGKLDSYRKETKNQVKTIGEDEFLVL